MSSLRTHHFINLHHTTDVDKFSYHPKKMSLIDKWLIKRTMMVQFDEVMSKTGA